MNKSQRFLKNVPSLKGKTVAVTGSTGGIGKSLCQHLATLGADLILLDRSPLRSQAHRDELIKNFGVSVSCITLELEDEESVHAAAKKLEYASVDILILNAGAYKIPRHICKRGYDNIFQINFVSPYLLVKLLLPSLDARGGRVIAVGSIAHRYSKADVADVDFSTRKSCALAYGNSKRYLMFSLYELFSKETNASLSVTHPGITLTNITAHYPKLIFALIKYPMKLIFMNPSKASLCVLQGVFEQCGYYEWIGPRFFDIWGTPRKKQLCRPESLEIKLIKETAEKI